MDIEQMRIRMGEMAAEIERLQSHIPEWLCDKCNCVHPAPKNLAQTICKCGNALRPSNLNERNLGAENARLQSIIDAQESPAVAAPDNCEVCKGSKGGVRGNENVINGIRVCDYCSADESYKSYSPSPRITEQEARTLELEFMRIMSGINSVDFEFVNGEPEPAPRSGKSVPVILGVAWKVFKAAKHGGRALLTKLNDNNNIPN